jgi:primosomal protein N' (replication factor Y) (superfamily II helicase)
MNNGIANVSLPLPFDRLFTYTIPPELREDALPGARVLVPFGKKHKIGYIIELPQTTQLTRLKPILDILDPKPVFTPDMLQLCKWIAEYYIAPLGEVLRSATPAGMIGESKRIISLRQEPSFNLIEDWRKRSPRKAAIIHTLQEHGELSINQLQKLTRFENIYSALNELERENYIDIRDQLPRTSIKPRFESYVGLNTTGRKREDIEGERSRLDKRAKKQIAVLEELLKRDTADPIPEKELLRTTGASRSVLKTLTDRELIAIEKREVSRETIEIVAPPEPLTLTGHQEDVVGKLKEALDAEAPHTFLLHGITGSGKTQVYIEAIYQVLSQKKTAIVLVPEISLTPQIVQRFRGHFRENVVVFHSRLSEGERYDAWRRARDGKASIAIGPRSAIFAPLENVGLIIVDEEHEASYKQYDSSPRYNARDVAIMRAHFNKAVVVLGSATPSLESYHNALGNKYTLLELPERVNTYPLPKVHVIDMRAEREAIRTEQPGTKTAIARLLREHIRERMKRHEGIILLQNRRGFSPFLECLDCGFIEECNECSVTMTFHKVKKHLRCHYCGAVRPAPDVCPKCNGIRLAHQGYGTQRVEEELQQLFPDARIARMDLDSTTRRGSHARILTRFARGEFDILLGTQMVAKGLDFERVTLVGVISADTQLLFPDFRAGERTFQMLTQVAGRSGRSTIEGEVIIQTNHPDHYSIRYATRHDFKAFYEEEIGKREQTAWPPVTRIALIEARSLTEAAASKTLEEIMKKLPAVVPPGFILLGPVPATLAKVKNQFRYHSIVKVAKQSDPSGKVLRESIKKSLPGKLPKNTRLIIDIDPYGVL